MASTAFARPDTASQKTPGSQQDRLRYGREQRKTLSRSKLGDVNANRKLNAVDLLLRTREGRLARLLPLKYSRMKASPFAFFRGAVGIMSADLANAPNTGLTVQLCGDAHVQNLGCFEGPDSRLVFDINDFDESIAGPWEWDIKRMATSIVLAGYDSGHRRSACSGAVETFAASYCASIEEFADQPVLVAARHQIHRAQKTQPISAALKQAERAAPSDLLKKYTEKGANGMPRFKTIENMLWPVKPQQRREILQSLTLYRETLMPERLHWFEFFHPIDVAFKVVGTGSVGLRDYVVLMHGNGPEDALFLQIKQEVVSAYAAYLDHAPFANQGQRVVDGQRKIQPQSDLLLGWTHIGEHDYLVRQLNDHKGSIDLKLLHGEQLSHLASVAGELLARGHARSGDAMAIKGYIGTCDKVVAAVVKYALEYASVTEADFESFLRAIDQKRLKTIE